MSKLHGEVSRSLWKDVWAGVPVQEVPITSITNGIHTKTWMAPEFSALYTKYLGDWEERLTDHDFWRGVMDIPDAQLWETHQKLKLRLVEFVRERVRIRRTRVGESMEAIRRANQILDPEILTIGFARRFATYKRGALLFSDKERLARLLNDTTRPVQFIFAGKSHPRDEGGKALIKEVYQFSRQQGFENRIVFVEDYDTYIARRLVQGVDLWLNNPLRPLEASGTSGMKLPPNGGLNLSVLDGWWCESYNGKNGWAIGAEIDDGSGRVPKRSRREQSLSIARKPDHPALLRQARRQTAARLAAVDARIDPQRHARLQHPPHGAGIHRASLPSGGASAGRIRARRLPRRASSSANGKRASAKIGRRCASTMCRSETKIATTSWSAIPCAFPRKSISAASIRKTSGSKPTTAKPITTRCAIPPSRRSIKATKPTATATTSTTAPSPRPKAACTASASALLPTHPHLVQAHELRLITWS